MPTEMQRTMQEAAPPRVVLEVLTSSLAGKRFAFGSAELRGGVMLGRAPDCKVRFDGARDLKVSGHHALLEERAEGVFLRDQGSSNGLYVNRERVTAAGMRLYDGYEISLGQEGAVVRAVIPADPAPPVSQLPPVSGRQPASGGDMTRIVESVGAKVGAGDKTKHMIKAVAEQLESRADTRRAGLVTMVGAMFLLLLALGAIGVWYYQNQETLQAQADEREKQAQAARDKKLDDAEAERSKRDTEREQEMAELRKKFGALETAMADQVKTLRDEQDKRFETLRKDVDDATAARVKEISEAQLKQLKEATEAQLKELEKLQSAPTDEKFRDLAEKYNASVFLIFVQYPLLNAAGEAVGIESGTGTGWLVKTSDKKAWVITNKHVIKPFLFKHELAISHAIQDVRPAPVKDWVIAAWQPGTKLRDKAGDTRLTVADAWATVPNGWGGRGRVRITGYADDVLMTYGDNYAQFLAGNGFKTDLPEEIISRVKQISIHRMDTSADLALLEFERTNTAHLAEPLPMASDEELRALKQMESVMSLGYPLGLSVIKGTTVTTSPATGNLRSIQLEVGVIGTSAPILPGNSGGPLIHVNGKVVGVITLKWGTGDTQGEAISVDHARALVKKLLE